MTTAPREDITAPIPQNADHAVLMFCIAHDWLKQNAPERFTEAHQRALSQAGGEREIYEKCAAIARSFRCGEQLIRHKMSHVDQVGVVAETIARAILEAAPSPSVSVKRERGGRG